MKCRKNLQLELLCLAESRGYSPQTCITVLLAQQSMTKPETSQAFSQSPKSQPLTVEDIFWTIEQEIRYGPMLFRPVRERFKWLQGKLDEANVRYPAIMRQKT